MRNIAKKSSSDRAPLSHSRELLSRRFALRCGNRDFTLPEGDTVIGRATSCDLLLDDPLVSRRHARIRVSGDRVTLLDLGSRNGVMLHQHRIDGEVTLGCGDQLRIGNAVFTLVEERRGPERRPPASAADASRTLTDFQSPVPRAAEEEETTCTAHAFELLGGVVDKALATGRSDEVIRLLASHLEHFARDCEAGQRLPEATLAAVARYAIKLGEATQQPSWFELLLRVYSAQAEPLPLEAVDALYRLLRHVRGVSRARLRAYVERLHDRTPTFGPAERFATKRIEGLLQIMLE